MVQKDNIVYIVCIMGRANHPGESYQQKKRPPLRRSLFRQPTLGGGGTPGTKNLRIIVWLRHLTIYVYRQNQYLWTYKGFCYILPIPLFQRPLCDLLCNLIKCLHLNTPISLNWIYSPENIYRITTLKTYCLCQSFFNDRNQTTNNI